MKRLSIVMYSVNSLIPKNEKAASLIIFSFKSLSYTKTGDEIEEYTYLDKLFISILELLINAIASYITTNPTNCPIVLPGKAGIPINGKTVSKSIPSITNSSA